MSLHYRLFYQWFLHDMLSINIKPLCSSHWNIQSCSFRTYKLRVDEDIISYICCSSIFSSISFHGKRIRFLLLLFWNIFLYRISVIFVSGSLITFFEEKITKSLHQIFRDQNIRFNNHFHSNNFPMFFACTLRCNIFGLFYLAC